MRILAIDYGRKRIGIAVSDQTNSIARAVCVIETKGNKQNFNRIKEFIDEFDITDIVIGLSKKSDGTLGVIGEESFKFGKYLETRLDLNIIFFDEAMTTKDAQSMLIKTNVSRKKRAKDIDKFAAAVILQEYLNNRR